jgi:hypothetical protein
MLGRTFGRAAQNHFDAVSASVPSELDAPDVIARALDEASRVGYAVAILIIRRAHPIPSHGVMVSAVGVDVDRDGRSTGALWRRARR